MKIYVHKIIPNPQQPRTVFDTDYLNNLANSIRENGLEQEILVEDNKDGTYTLVDGECRWRAHKLIGAKTIEAKVREKTNHDGLGRLVSATAANVARDGLHPVDEGNAYQKMSDAGMSAQKIAKSCGTTTTNVYLKLKLAKFTYEEQEILKQGSIPMTGESIDALLSIPNKTDRIDMVMVLGKHGATTRVVVNACNRFITAKKEVRERKIAQKKAEKFKLKKKIAETPALELIDEKPIEWDALYQVNKVPPWPKFTEAVMATCDHCALKPSASASTCGGCPQVDMIERLLGSIK